MRKFITYLIFFTFSNICFGQGNVVEKDINECFRESVNLDYIFFKKNKKGKEINNEVWDAIKHPDSIFTAHSNVFDQTALIGLEKCSKLCNLSLAYSKLDSFPKQIFSLPNLRVISFTGYRWHTQDFKTPTTIPEGFDNLMNLKILKLDCNNIEKLPEDIGSMSKLEILSLHNNALKTIPSSISKLNNLKQLDISVNKMDEIPECIFSLTKLKTLYLYGNNFKVEDINRLKKALPKTKIKTEPN